MDDEVRQEDREAAVALYKAEFIRSETLLTNIVSGLCDGMPSIQAFARHASPLRTRIAVQDHALDCLVEFAKTAIRMLQGAEKDTGWGEPMFGDPNSEVMQKRLDEILARATLNGEKKHG